MNAKQHKLIKELAASLAKDALRANLHYWKQENVDGDLDGVDETCYLEDGGEIVEQYSDITTEEMGEALKEIAVDIYFKLVQKHHREKKKKKSR